MSPTPNKWIAIYNDCVCRYGETPTEAFNELVDNSECGYSDLDFVDFYNLTDVPQKALKIALVESHT